MAEKDNSGVALRTRLLMWPTLRAIEALGGSGTFKEIDAKVNELQLFPPEQTDARHGHGRRSGIEYCQTWARNYLQYYGAIERSGRGVWAITAVGRGLSEDDVAGIPLKAAASQGSKGAQLAPPDQKGLVGAEESLGSDWQERLIEVLTGMLPPAFERLCMRMLRESGFTKVEVTGRSGDQGIDGVGVLHMSLLSFPVFFQCKRYRDSVGPSAIRDFRGAMTGRGDKGILITTGTFTNEAVRESTRDGAPLVDLINGNGLCDLLKQYRLGVGTEQVERVTIDPQWFQAI